MIKDIWKIEKKDVIKVNSSELLQLTHFHDEIKSLKKVIKSINFNRKLENREAKHIDKEGKKNGNFENNLLKTKIERARKIDQLKKKILHVKQVGKVAKERFKREGYLTTFIDKTYKKKNYGKTPEEFKKIKNDAIKMANSLKYDYSCKNLTILSKKDLDFKNQLKNSLGFKRFLIKHKTFLLKPSRFDKTIYNYKLMKKKHEIKSVYSYKSNICSEKLEIKINMMTETREEFLKNISAVEKILDKTKNKKYSSILFNKPNNKNYVNTVSKEYKSKLAELIESRKNKTISWKAFKEEKKILRNVKKEKAYNNLLNDKEFALCNEILTMRRLAKKRLLANMKLINSELDEVHKRIPSEVSPIMKWVITPLSIIIPGISFFVRGQIKSGLLFMIFLPIMAILTLYALGKFNVNGDGIFGLKDAGLKECLVDINVDSRFWVIEGIISAIFLIIVIGYVISIMRTTFKTYKALELGINPKTWSDVKRGLQANGYPYFMSIPALLVILLIVVTPILSTLYFSMTNYGPGALPPGQLIEFIGFKNYKVFFSDPGMLTSLKRVILWTLFFTIIASTLSIIAGIGLGMLTQNERLRGRKLFRVIFLLPTAIPGFITIGMISLMISPEGILSKWTGVTTWKTNLTHARIIIMIIQMWVGYSASYLMTIGVISAVPSDQKEAAEIDGVGRFRRQYHLVLPIIIFQLTPLIISTFLATFNNFGIIYLVTNGGPSYAVASFGRPGATDTVISWVLKLTEGSNPFHGISAAFLMITTLMILPITAFSLLRSKAVRKEAL